MAVFERERASRRFFSLSGDPRPTAPGGIPSGSVLQHTDTGDRFIYDGDERIWHPFVGVEDSISVLEEIRDSNSAIELLLEDIRDRFALTVG